MKKPGEKSRDNASLKHYIFIGLSFAASSAALSLVRPSFRQEKHCNLSTIIRHYDFYKTVFTRAVTPHLLRFWFYMTVNYPGPVQVTVGEPYSNPGQLRPLSGVAQLP
jgi:hypothetical protein